MDINYQQELQKARQAIEGLERTGQPATISAYWDVCCGDVLVAEENAQEMNRVWENSSLAKELLDIAAYLEGYDHMLNKLNTAVSRMIDVLYDHPSLTLRLLEFQLLVLHRIEAQHDHELGETEEVEQKIRLYRHNIDCADKGDFDNIRPIGHLKNDPIEWSAEYESNIDEAHRKIYAQLEDLPRGMGFCFAYWHAKQQVLKEDYDIEWKTPSQMNPGVMFD